MSALYDSSLFANDDMAEAYSNGFNTAKHTLMITVTTVCPVCMEPLVVTKHPLCSLPLIVHSDLRCWTHKIAVKRYPQTQNQIDKDEIFEISD